jgi:uncharacterized protein YkwD
MIRTLFAALLLTVASPALAEITFAIGEPAEGSTRSGIGLVSGWAVSDLGIVSIELFIDGESIGFIPYGSPRGDVAAAFPDIPDALWSGWGMKWAYSLTGEGEHTMRFLVTEEGGGTASKEVTFNVIRFRSEFISDPEDIVTGGATVESPIDGRLVISGAQIEGETADVELAWDTASQQFLIDRITFDGEQKPNQAPMARAGSNRSVESGASVSLTGEGSDPDGFISSFGWTQVSGPDVALEGSDDWTVRFTAPAEAAEIRLRFQVTDDEGLSDTDDVLITVNPPPNELPQVYAGENFTVMTGEEVSITATGSDSDGEIVSWSWSVISGTSVTLQDATTRTVRFTAPASEGHSRIRILVTDDDGAIDTDVVQVNYEAPVPSNQAPTANAGSNLTVETGDSVTVNGSGSDSDGSIVNWAWTQVSGTTVSLTGADSPDVSFTAPGDATTIRLRLTVTDDDGATDSDEMLVTVEEPLSDTTTGSTLHSMLDELNAARATARTCGDTEYEAQPALAWSESLADIAMQHSMDMASKSYFSHTSADGTSMATRVWPYWDGITIGENIAASSANRDDQYIIDLWLDSPGHCALIMAPDFTHVGIGVGHDTENGYTYHHFWTMDFGG